jgi:hypothetical protein
MSIPYFFINIIRKKMEFDVKRFFFTGHSGGIWAAQECRYIIPDQHTKGNHPLGLLKLNSKDPTRVLNQ